MSWYQKITNNPEQYEIIADALEDYRTHLVGGLADLEVKNQLLWDVSRKLPSLMAWRYQQYQELEAIYDFLKLKERKTYQDKVKMYLEHYNKTLSERMAQSYAENDLDVIFFKEIGLEVQLIMNQFAGLTKGLEAMSFQIQVLAKMKQAGIEDARI